MRIASAGIRDHSALEDVDRAVGALADDIEGRLGGAPDLVMAYQAEQIDSDALAASLAARFPGAAVMGCTSCQGAMTQDGVQGGLGLWAVTDPGGCYGVGLAKIGDRPEDAALAALDRALNVAGRPGESPDLIWMHAAPGHEEAIVAAIDGALGGTVPIAGGSCADDAVAGNWRMFAGGNVAADGVALCAMFPSTSVSYAFLSGYAPTETSGVITAASGRTVETIDGEAAAEVYNRWTGGLIADSLAGGSVLTSTTLYPLGREVGAIRGPSGRDISYYNLAHPECVTASKGLSLFAETGVGERVILMNGTVDSLVTRAGRVADAAVKAGGLTADGIEGALAIYCAGCMLTVNDALPDVVGSINAALGGRPFLGAFTFGEQGCFTGGENRHGNLMISIVVFGKSAA